MLNRWFKTKPEPETELEGLAIEEQLDNLAEQIAALGQRIEVVAAELASLKAAVVPAISLNLEGSTTP